MATCDEDHCRLDLARAIRDACLRAAIEQCEDARMAGLCWEGAWEVAISAIRELDIEAILHEQAARR